MVNWPSTLILISFQCACLCCRDWKAKSHIFPDFPEATVFIWIYSINQKYCHESWKIKLAGGQVSLSWAFCRPTLAWWYLVFLGVVFWSWQLPKRADLLLMLAAWSWQRWSGLRASSWNPSFRFSERFPDWRAVSPLVGQSLCSFQSCPWELNVEAVSSAFSMILWATELMP